MEAIETDVPVRSAYNQWTQFEEFPQFMEGVREVRQLDDTQVRRTARVAGDTHPSRGARASETGAWRGQAQQDPMT